MRRSLTTRPARSSPPPAHAADLAPGLKATGNIEAAKAVGKQIAAVALARGIKKVCFDRRGRKYHGRVKALAEPRAKPDWFSKAGGA